MSDQDLQPEFADKAKQVFYEALSYEGNERQQYVESACDGDRVLRQAVLDLLASLDHAGRRLESPVMSDAGLMDHLDLAAMPSASGRNVPDQSHVRRQIESRLEPSESDGVLGLFDGFEVSRVIGQGGMGVVLHAVDTRLERDVAIKVLSPQLALDPEAHARFLREARVLASIRDPHVVQVFAVSEFKGLPYMVMELIHGMTLQQKLDREGTLPTNEILRIATQIAAGLVAVHAKGMTHQDIKPGNILLEEQTRHVKIGDFGLARPDSGSDEVGSEPFFGTPKYMSPEQASGSAVDTRSDLFSLGVVLYAMCAGGSPFEDESTVGTLMKVSKEQPEDLRAIAADIPGELIRLIDELLSKDPQHRVHSASEVLRRIQAIRSGKHRRKVFLVNAASASLVLLLLLGAAWWRGWLFPSHGPELGIEPTQSVIPLRVSALGPEDLLVTDVWTWSEPKPFVPANARGSISTHPVMSSDGLSLYYTRYQHGSRGQKREIYVCKRTATDETFSRGRSLGSPINSPENEWSIAISADQLTMILSSNREGGRGQHDLWMSTRTEIGNDWPAPTLMDEPFNTAADEIAPWISADGLVLLFIRDQNVYQSLRDTIQESFGEPILIEAPVSTSEKQIAAWMSKDRLTMLVTALHIRPDGQGKDYDIWMHYRESPDAPFGQRVNLSTPINSMKIDGHPTFSPDGKIIYFYSNRHGGSSGIYYSRRVPAQ